MRTGDLDGDGDQDLIVLMMELNPNPLPSSGGPPSPFVSRLVAWERTPGGLVERGDVMRTPEMRFAMPYQLADVDDDGDLDVVGFEHGTPIGYVNDGAFGFSRVMLGGSAPGLEDTGTLLLEHADRNQDGSPDLLVIVGSFAGNQLENDMFVLLGEGAGKFGAPGPATKGEAPLVPHGPDGVGLGAADVTGDGIADILAQDSESTESAPILKLYASTSPTTLAPAKELQAHGFEFADVDEDGQTDIVTTSSDRLVALLSRGGGAFEERDLGIRIAMPETMDFVVDPGRGTAPAVLHVLYKSACR